MQARGEEEITADVFDVLLSLGDFTVFKDIMLSYKASKAGRCNDDLNLSLDGSSVSLHMDEQEEGDEYPDLELSISPMHINKKPDAKF